MRKIKERVVKNPLTSVAGIMIILCGIVLVSFGKIESLTFAEISSLGLILLGLKDPV